MSKPITILFLGANPVDTLRLRLGDEAREIGRRIQLGNRRERIQLEHAWAPRPDELSQLLLRHRPAILHISAHGKPTGELLLHSATDAADAPSVAVPQAALANLLRLLVPDGLRAVVLNACHSATQARAIAEHVDYAIGVSETIGDKAALDFTIGFYTGIAHGKSLQAAFSFGQAQIEVKNQSGADRLCAYSRHGVDPGSVYVLQPNTGGGSDQSTDPVKPAIQIAIVAVEAELGEACAAVAARVRALPQVTSVQALDAAAQSSLTQASNAAIIVVLVGGRTGGTTVLGELFDRGAIALKPAQSDLDLIDPTELAAGQSLRRRVTEKFNTPEEAANLAVRLVSQRITELLKPKPGQAPLLEPWERAYLEVGFRRWELGNEGGLRARAEASDSFVSRARLYVSLRADATPSIYLDKQGQLIVDPEHDALAGHTKPHNKPAPDNEEEKPRGAPYLEQVLSHAALPHVLVEGEAGSGKTVLLEHVAYALAAHHLGKPAPAARLDLAGLAGNALALRIPLHIEARNLAQALTRGTAGELLDFLIAELRQHTGDKTIPEDAVCAGLKERRYLLLVDSLDEVPGQEGRARVLNCLADVVALGWPLRLVLSTRPAAHVGSVAARGLRRVRIARLDDEAVQALIDRWAEARQKGADYREALHAALAKLVERHGDDRAGITENPLLLTAAMWVYDQQRGVLPDSPAELYERMVRLLCDARPQSALDPRSKRMALRQVLTGIQHTDSTARPLRDAAQDILRMKADLPAVAGFEVVDHAETLIERLGAETGLLRFEEGHDNRGRPLRLVRPWHRSFQEYLTACQLASTPDSVERETDRLFEARERRPPVVEAPEWEGVLVFLVGVYWQRDGDSARAYLCRLFEHAQGITDKRITRPGRLLGLVARGLAEYPMVLDGDPLREKVCNAIVREFAKTGMAWPLSDRLLALESLGRLGDPRLHEDPWVEIAGGEFDFGDGEEYSIPPRRERVASFRLCWHPVTIEEYAQFVEDGGYGERSFWAAGGYGEQHEPDDWRAQHYHRTRPVVGLSWYEAMAYCRWASLKLGLQIDLPTEIEWEFAARGNEGRVYPWGNEDPGKGDAARANHWTNGDFLVGHPSPIGAFPRGNQGRLVDLAGNVWEWCQDIYTDDARPPSTGDTDTAGAARVVRGGSWSSVPGFLRAAISQQAPSRVPGRPPGFPCGLPRCPPARSLIFLFLNFCFDLLR